MYNNPSSFKLSVDNIVQGGRRRSLGDLQHIQNGISVSEQQQQQQQQQQSVML